MSLVLKHNDTAVDLDAAHCELGSLVRSFLGPWSLTLRRAIAFDEPTDWQNEDAIELTRDGTTVFEGAIKSSERWPASTWRPNDPCSPYIHHTCSESQPDHRSLWRCCVPGARKVA